MITSFIPKNKHIICLQFYHILEYHYKTDIANISFHFEYCCYPVEFNLAIHYNDKNKYHDVMMNDYQFLKLKMVLNSKNKLQLKFKEKYKFKTKKEKDIVTKFIKNNLDDIIPFMYIYGVGL